MYYSDNISQLSFILHLYLYYSFNYTLIYDKYTYSSFIETSMFNFFQEINKTHFLNISW